MLEKRPNEIDIAPLQQSHATDHQVVNLKSKKPKIQSNDEHTKFNAPITKLAIQTKH